MPISRAALEHALPLLGLELVPTSDVDDPPGPIEVLAGAPQTEERVG